MASVRLLLATRRGWLALLLALTLTARLMVPAGFMPSVERGTVTLRECSGVMPAAMPVAMPEMHHGPTHDAGHDRAETPCGFAGLAMPLLGAADPLLLAAALLLVAAAALRTAVPIRLAAPDRLRPPLRAPPLPA